MIEDAIKTIVSLMDRFPQVYKIEIVDIKDVILHYDDKYDNYQEKEFESSVEMIEWMETNLEQKS